MPTSISDPKITFKDLIKGQWIAANAENITPDFHTGFLNPQGAQYQVCFPNSAEATFTPSGYDAISPEGPVSRRTGTLPIMIFGRRSEKAQEQNTLNPKKFLNAARQEVERIVLAAFVSVTDMEYVSVIASAEQEPETEFKPPFFGWTVIAQYVWRRTLS